MADLGDPKVKGPSSAKKGEVVEIKTLIKHPMESGYRKDASGNVIPAHYINEVVVSYMGKEVLRSEWTGAVSKNPFFSFQVRAQESGDIKVVWKDTSGQSFEASSKLEVA